MGGTRSSCALAVGTGNADYLCGTQLEKDVNLRSNEFIIPAGDFEKFIIVGDCRVGYDNVGLLEISRVV